MLPVWKLISIYSSDQSQRKHLQEQGLRLQRCPFFLLRLRSLLGPVHVERSRHWAPVPMKAVFMSSDILTSLNRLRSIKTNSLNVSKSFTGEWPPLRIANRKALPSSSLELCQAVVQSLISWANSCTSISRTTQSRFASLAICDQYDLTDCWDDGCWLEKVTSGIAMWECLQREWSELVLMSTNAPLCTYRLAQCRNIWDK